MNKKRKPQKWLKVLPDLLTVSRLFIGLVISLIGPIAGKNGLYLVLGLLLLGWTTDIVDGRLARQIRDYHSTKIGQNEIRFDGFLIIGVLAYLGYSRFLPLGIATGGAALLFLLIILPSTSYKQIFFFEAPIATATSLYVVVLAGIPALGYFLLWGVLILIYDWSRAMELGKSFKSLLCLTAKKMFRLNLADNLLFSILVFLLIALLIILEMFMAEWSIKILGGVILALVFLVWKRRVDKN